jgi:hypothetical protein
MGRRWRRAFVVTFLIGAVLVPGRTAMANDLCNTTITTPGAVVTLLHNHTCPAGTGITIQADGVTLDLGGFRLGGSGTGDVGINVNTAAEDAVIRNGTIRGFAVGIQAGGTAGGSCFGSSPDLRVENVTVRNASDWGMWLCSEGASLVTGSSVVNSGGLSVGVIQQTGSGIWGSDGVDVESTSVSGGDGYGVHLVANEVLDDVAVRDSTVENFGARGVYMQGLGDGSITVEDTTVSGCTAVSCRGIWVSGEAGMLITGSTVSDVDFGIEAFNNQSHFITVEDTTVSQVTRDGISIFNSFLPVVTGSVVRDIGNDLLQGDNFGIRFSCTITGVVAETSVLEVDGDGVVIDESPSVPCVGGSDATMVRDSLIARTAGNGLVLAEGPDLQIRDNRFSSNDLDGIVVEPNAPGADLDRNRSVRNGEDGFQLNTADVALTDNEAIRNAGYGYHTVAVVATDGGNLALNNTLGDCNDASHLPNTCAGGPPPPPPGIALNGAPITGSTDSATSIVLPSWTPSANDVVLVAVATRDETVPVSVSGNGLSWTQVADVDNVQGQGGVLLFRGQGASPTTGSITVTLTGNGQAAGAIAQRFSGVNLTTPVEAVVTNSGPATDNDDMFDSVTTLTADAFAVAASEQRIAQLLLPAGETAIAVNQQAGTSSTYGSLWYEGPIATPGATQLGASNDLDNTNDWALILVALKPA